MKNKIIELTAITLALLMSVGGVSGAGYTMSTGFNVTLGYGYQTVEAVDPSFFAKMNTVTIGNYWVNATCVEDPMAQDPGALVKYDPDLKGTGGATTTISSDFDPHLQFQEITFGQAVSGNKIVVAQMTGVGGPSLPYGQWFFAATSGNMDLLSEDLSVKAHTCNDVVTAASILKSVSTKTTETDQKSLLWHKVKAPAPMFDPVFKIDQYLAAPDIGFYYDLDYLKP